MYCSKCGGKLDDDSEFCIYCGQKLYTDSHTAVEGNTTSKTSESSEFEDDAAEESSRKSDSVSESINDGKNRRINSISDSTRLTKPKIKFIIPLIGGVAIVGIVLALVLLRFIQWKTKKN